MARRRVRPALPGIADNRRVLSLSGQGILRGSHPFALAATTRRPVVGRPGGELQDRHLCLAGRSAWDYRRGARAPLLPATQRPSGTAVLALACNVRGASGSGGVVG